LVPEEFRKELENCLRRPRADCVDLLARITEKVYGKTALKVSGTKVTLGPLCTESDIRFKEQSSLV